MASKKITECAALASAALAMPLTAHASIMWSGPQSITETSNSMSGDQTYALNLGNGTDFTFTASFTSDEVKVTPGSQDAYLGNTVFGPAATPLMLGAAINGSSMTWLTTQGKIQSSICSMSGCTIKGPWPTNGSLAFMGVQFTLSGQIHYGWVGIQATTPDAPTSTFTLTGWAFQTTPNLGINAGDTGAVPEPSTLALLALGAAGIAVLRARRKRTA